MGLGKFPAHGGRVDLSDRGVEGGWAIGEDFDVLRAVEVFDQRGIGQQGTQGSPQGVAAGFVAAIAFEVAEEPLQEVVGALGLDAGKRGL